MTAIHFSGRVPAHALEARHWSDEILGHAGFRNWWTFEGSNLQTHPVDGVSRIEALRPRAGHASLAADVGASGPEVSVASAYPSARFRNGQNCGLVSPLAIARDDFALVVVADFGEVAPTQNRTLLGLSGVTNFLRLWRNPSTGWAWRIGSTDAAILAAPWVAGPTMLIAERAGDTMSLRLRNRSTTSAIATGVLAPATVPATLRLVLGMDRHTEGAALPSLSQSWNDHIHEAATYSGTILGSPARRAFWDDYFSSVYGV